MYNKNTANKMHYYYYAREKRYIYYNLQFFFSRSAFFIAVKEYTNNDGYGFY